jgi:endoribonuclease LACTB2
MLSMLVNLFLRFLSCLILWIKYVLPVHTILTWIQPVLARGKKNSKIPKGLPPLSAFEVVSDRCCRILGMNPGVHTLHGTNLYLIGLGKERVLVDTGEVGPAADVVKKILDEVLPSTGTTRISRILLTHGHYDHQGGVCEFLNEVKRRKVTPPLVYKRRIVRGGNGSGVEIGKYPAKGFDCEHLRNGEDIIIDEGTTLRCVYTPGHTDDSVCFILKEDFALLSGDSVLGCGTSVFDDLNDYMRSLRLIRQHFLCQESSTKKAKKDDDEEENKLPPLCVVYPGHGPVVSQQALAHIDGYITNRDNRERQLLEALQCSTGWVSSLELVPVVYGSSLPFPVWLSAQGNLLSHLDKLHKGHRVDRIPMLDLWRISGSREVSP